MNRYLLILITGCLLIALSGLVSALPSAHTYDCSDTTPTASDAQADQSIEYTKPGIQSLTWVITLKGEPDDHVLQGGLVVIDALTGKVLVTSPYL